MTSNTLPLSRLDGTKETLIIAHKVIEANAVPEPLLGTEELSTLVDKFPTQEIIDSDTHTELRSGLAAARTDLARFLKAQCMGNFETLNEIKEGIFKLGTLIGQTVAANYVRQISAHTVDKLSDAMAGQSDLYNEDGKLKLEQDLRRLVATYINLHNRLRYLTTS